jgi:CheY-like chemotaxis protein
MTDNTGRFAVWVIDDEVQVLESQEAFLGASGYEVITYSNPLDAEKELVTTKDFIVFILDHDFSMAGMSAYVGYDFSTKVRNSYYLGRAAPIIYVTGRESKENFLIAQSANPGLVPNIYFAKNELAADPKKLIEAISDAYAYLEDLETLIDEHGFEIALGIVTDWRF